MASSFEAPCSTVNWYGNKWPADSHLLRSHCLPCLRGRIATYEVGAFFTCRQFQLEIFDDRLFFCGRAKQCLGAPCFKSGERCCTSLTGYLLSAEAAVSADTYLNGIFGDCMSTVGVSHQGVSWIICPEKTSYQKE